MATATQTVHIRRAARLHRRRGRAVVYWPAGDADNAIDTFAFFGDAVHTRESRSGDRTKAHRVLMSVPKEDVDAVRTDRDRVVVPGEVVGESAETVQRRVGRVVAGREGGGSWVVELVK